MTKKLPVYRPEEIPAGLATVTMLRKQRRKPAPGQAPAATLVYLGGKEQTDLFRIADTAPMKPLTARQLAAADRNRAYPRICDVCGKDTGAPIHPSGPMFVGTPRVHRCEACGREHRYAGFVAQRPANRANASAWAREVLADPTTVIVAARAIDVRQHDQCPYVKRSAVAAVSILPGRAGGDRQDLVGVLHAYLIPQEPPRRKRDLTPDAVLIREAAGDIIARLRGRRIVAWYESEVDGLNRDLWDAASDYGRDEVTGWPRLHRVCYMPRLLGMSHQYSQWVGEIQPQATGWVDQQRPPGEPTDVTGWILRTLQRMADSPQRIAEGGEPRG